MVFGWNAPPAPPQVAQHLAQDVIEELELELADREAKRRRLVVQSSYASVLLFALAEPADLVLVRWPAGMVSVARVMSAPAEAAPNLLHVECCITADGERIRGAVPPSAVEVVNEHNFERLLAEVPNQLTSQRRPSANAISHHQLAPFTASYHRPRSATTTVGAEARQLAEARRVEEQHRRAGAGVPSACDQDDLSQRHARTLRPVDQGARRGDRFASRAEPRRSGLVMCGPASS